MNHTKHINYFDAQLEQHRFTVMQFFEPRAVPVGPNNPTGVVLTLKDITELTEAHEFVRMAGDFPVFERKQ